MADREHSPQLLRRAVPGSTMIRPSRAVVWRAPSPKRFSSSTTGRSRRSSTAGGTDRKISQRPAGIGSCTSAFMPSASVGTHSSSLQQASSNV
eukprot:3937390-Rhodomonas_salina.1